MNKENCLLSLVMFYMTIKVTTALMIYKIINIFGIHISASTLIIPLWFLTGDIIAELYGYRVARNIIWLAVIFQFVFALICGLFAYIPSATNVLNNQLAYQEILGGLPRVAFASFIGIMAGAIFNAYIINKWRILLKGKYFGLRSIGASSLGELIFTVCVYLIEFLGKTNSHNIFQLLVVSYVVKLIINPIFVIPVAIIAGYLKKKINNPLDLNKIKTPENAIISKLIELYTSDDGKSYFRDVILDTPIKHPLGLYSKKFNVADLQFREFSANATFDWHVAPQQQYIIYQEGSVEVLASGGETRIFNPGDILLASDTSGRGHITTTLTNGKSIVITTKS